MTRYIEHGNRVDDQRVRSLEAENQRVLTENAALRAQVQALLNVTGEAHRRIDKLTRFVDGHGGRLTRLSGETAALWQAVDTLRQWGAAETSEEERERGGDGSDAGAEGKGKGREE